MDIIIIKSEKFDALIATYSVREKGKILFSYPLECEYNPDRNSFIFGKENLKKIAKFDQSELAEMHRILKREI